MVAAQRIPGARNMSMESLFEYGSRVGVWRVLALFRRYGMPLTVYGVAVGRAGQPTAAGRAVFPPNQTAGGATPPPPRRRDRPPHPPHPTDREKPQPRH